MSHIINFLIKMLLGVAVIALLYYFTSNRVSFHKENPYNTVGSTIEQKEKQLACLAKNIYFEAGSEPFEGKIAVAQVTINRANSGKWPGDICDVVYQKNVVYGKIICQFSWYCEAGPKVRYNPQYKDSMEVARKVLLENFHLPSLRDAYYYHADYVNPNWNLPKITKIGRHIFYGEKR